MRGQARASMRVHRRFIVAVLPRLLTPRLTHPCDSEHNSVQQQLCACNCNRARATATVRVQLQLCACNCNRVQLAELYILVVCATESVHVLFRMKLRVAVAQRRCGVETGGRRGRKRAAEVDARRVALLRVREHIQWAPVIGRFTPADRTFHPT